MPKCNCLKFINNSYIANLHASYSMDQNFTTSEQILMINKPLATSF